MLSRGSSATSILAVAESPGDDAASLELQDLLDEFGRRPACTATTWFLRRGSSGDVGSNDRVVDDLRTDWRTARIEALFGAAIGARARGLWLRSWEHSVDPHLVVLDDGVGHRVIHNWQHRVVVLRLTSRLEPSTAGEELFGGRPRLVLAESLDDARLPPGVPVIEFVHRRDRRSAAEAAEYGARSRRRVAADLVTDAPLVMGWSDDAWNESGDLFVRTLWNAHQRGAPLHGCWLTPEHDVESRQHVMDEARRCGIDAYVTTRADPHVALECLADVVMLPSRAGTSSSRVRNVLCSGSRVVTFDRTDVGVVSDSIVRVPDLDLRAAATAVVASIDGDRRERSDRAVAQFGVRAIADDMLDVLGVG